jgi:hypothetical protein
MATLLVVMGGRDGRIEKLVVTDFSSEHPTI